MQNSIRVCNNFYKNKIKYIHVYIYIRSINKYCPVNVKVLECMNVSLRGHVTHWRQLFCLASRTRGLGERGWKGDFVFTKFTSVRLEFIPCACITCVWSYSGVICDQYACKCTRTGLPDRSKNPAFHGTALSHNGIPLVSI